MTTYKPPAAPPATPGNARTSRIPTWDQTSEIFVWYSAACLTVVAVVAIAARTIEDVDAETASKVTEYMTFIWMRGTLVLGLGKGWASLLEKWAMALWRRG